MEPERLNPQQFRRFRDFIYQHSGIYIDEKKVTLLSNRIRRRLKAGQFANFESYYEFMTSRTGSGELDQFLDAITTNETFFFRTDKHFEWLKNSFATELVAQQRAGMRSPSLRIWSAGCATGAEPYSIAICLTENAYRLPDWSLTVLGTDISEAALREARQAVYAPRALEMVSPQQRRRYFQKSSNEELYQVRPRIRRLVEFEKHNLMETMQQPPFDCIFIRNVLIYFNRASKQVVIEHLLRALKPGGYMVVGPSEGIYDMLSPLEKISPFLYQKVSNGTGGKTAARSE